jgi:tRNA1(Val) A37 N6-methylase TrmN6
VQAKVTIDKFLDGRLTVLQLEKGPRTSIDAIFLAAAVKANNTTKITILEAGTGCGIVSLALGLRLKDAQITGVEIQPDLCELARQNAKENRLENRICFINNDITKPVSKLDENLKPESFDHVVANPPYYEVGHARCSPHAARSQAYTLTDGMLEKWLQFLSTMTVPGGILTMIHRPETLPKLLSGLKNRFGGIAIYPLFSRPNLPAKRIIIHGTKGSRAPVGVYRGMVLHNTDGSFTDAANAVLRKGEPLAF